MLKTILEIEEKQRLLEDLLSLQERVFDYKFAIRMTNTYMRKCSTPAIKDLHIAAVKYYEEKLGVYEKEVEELSRNLEKL